LKLPQRSVLRSSNPGTGCCQAALGFMVLGTLAAKGAMTVYRSPCGCTQSATLRTIILTIVIMIIIIIMVIIRFQTRD
jgi:hypothetical protein